MKPMGNIPIKSKLVFLTMLTTVGALLISSSTFMYLDQKIIHKNLIEDLQVLAKSTAERSTAAIIFDDHESSNRLLHSLNHDPTILKACIYDIKGKLFSSYTVSNQLCLDTLDDITKQKGTHIINTPINMNSKKIGTIHILASLIENKSRLFSFILISISIILITSLIALYFSNMFYASITQPLIKLKTLTEHITNTDDYSQKLNTSQSDEIGALYSSFNKMINQLQNRETARNNAEKKLKESEYNLTITLSSIGDGFIATDINGKVTQMNSAAESLTGWNLSDAVNTNITDMFNIFDLETDNSLNHTITNSISTGSIIHNQKDIKLISRTSTTHIINYTTSPIRNTNKQILGMALVFNDITEHIELRESASKIKRDLQAIMDHSPAVIYVKDISGKYSFVNTVFKDIFHLSSNDILGKTDFDLFPPDIAKEFQNNDMKVLSAKKSLEIEEQAPQDDGLHTYISIKFPMINNKDEIYSIGGISTDITDRKINEEKLHQTQKMQALGKLTGGIAHDYNNMLGIILGYSELLESSLTRLPDLQKYAQEIIRAGNRGSQLTKKMLNFSRTKPAEMTIFNINELLIQERQLLEKTLTARIKLIYNLPDEKCLVKLDSGDLEDAIINMCINSMHAIQGNGQITISVQYYRARSNMQHNFHITEGHYILLSIADTGTGITDDIKQKIFEPFYSTKGEMGTGLGLSQVYGFLKRAGGYINVRSVPQEYTIFDLYFPAYTEETPTIHQSTLSDLTHSGHEAILVVDDEPSLLSLTVEILQNNGYLAYSAHNALDALAILSDKKVDLLLSDVIMPDINGFQLAKQVQAEYPSIKIQLISGYADIYDQGLDDDNLKLQILHKPYTSKALLQKIRQLLDADTNSAIQN